MEPAATIRRSHRAVYRKLADGEGGVLLNLDSAAYHGINEVGTVIWADLERGPTLGSLLASLRDRLADPPAGWDQDVVAFLHDLADRHLITVEAEC